MLAAPGRARAAARVCRSKIDDRRGVEREHLGDDEAAHNRDAERPAQLGASARAERQRKDARIHAPRRDRGGSHRGVPGGDRLLPLRRADPDRRHGGAGFSARGGAIAAAAGFIDFMGYVGAFSGDIVTGWLLKTRTFETAITFWAAAAFVAAICVATLWRRDH